MRNLTNYFTQKAVCFFATLSICLFASFSVFAQPADLPWDTDPLCESIVTTGIVAVSCGVLQSNPVDENFTFGMLNLNGALPAGGRIDVTATTQMYHHPSWLVDSLGNVFGITMDHCGNTYTTASSQYSSAYFGQQGIIRYGEIGGGSEDLQAAGTIYKIDAVTGQASVFAVLPQQSYNFTNTPCEGGLPVDRTTGPGLGNIIFNFTYNMFYVTNFEDGRIYRVDLSGNIIDSYDPLTYDNGATGPPTFDDIAYGLDITNDDSKLFFGTVGESFGGGMASIYSIDLEPGGAFPGVVDNTNLPAGATWDNYVDTELFHVALPDSDVGSMSYVSDLEFVPNGNLLVGNRVGCSSNIHTSYNHGGRSWIIEPVAGDIYSNTTIIYTSDGFISDNNAYGGVSVFENPLGTTEYVISSADMLSEQGPHGICTQEEGNYGAPFGAPASPAGIIAYIPGGIPFDVKGIGGDVYVYKECACLVVCPDSIVAEDQYVCSGEPFSLDITNIGGSAELDATWTDTLGNVISNPDSVVLTHTECAPGEVAFYVTAICLEDSTQVYTDTAIITVLTDDISPYVSSFSDSCSVNVEIDSACTDYITLLDTIPIINPGDSGTVCLTLIQNAPIVCDTLTICLDYDCPCTSECCPDDIETFPLVVCNNDTFDLSFEIINGISDLDVTWTDDMGNTVDPNDYTIEHTACAPGDYPFYVTAICLDDTSMVYTDTLVVTVVTDDISPFVSIIEEPCEVGVIIDSLCTDYLEVIGFIPDINPGDSGTVCVSVVQTTPISCDTLEICLDYDCPCDSSCCPTEIETSDLILCSGDLFDLEVTILDGISDVTINWTDDMGNAVDPNGLSIDNDACAPSMTTYNVEVICADDPSIVLTASLTVTVVTDDISPFITVVEEPCEIDVIIDPDCTDFIEVNGTIPPINPGESGTVTLEVVQTTDISCTSIDLTLNYDCPCDETCCPDELITTPLDLCSGDIFDLEVEIIGGNSNVDVTWTDIDGNPVNPDELFITHTDCAPGSYPFIVTVDCLDFPGFSLTDTVTMNVVTDDISPFVTLIEEDCNIEVIIDPDCLEYLQVDGTIPTISPGDSGTIMIDIIQTTSISCDVYPVELSYDCDCSIDAIVATPLECQPNGEFSVLLDVTVTNNSTSFTLTDQDGNTQVVQYADLPIQLGPFQGDSTSTWSYTLVDNLDEECTGAFSFGPIGCPVCGMCEMPNAFTPDADGHNDEFTLVCDGGLVEITEFQIYNRWGAKVHDSTEPWRGMFKGAPAPSDVYIYRLVYDTTCEVKELTGDVHLIR